MVMVPVSLLIGIFAGGARRDKNGRSLLHRFHHHDGDARIMCRAVIFTVGLCLVAGMVNGSRPPSATSQGIPSPISRFAGS